MNLFDFRYSKTDLSPPNNPNNINHPKEHKSNTQHKQCYLFNFSLRLFVTTLTLLNAIAAPAIIGFNRKPLIG